MRIREIYERYAADFEKSCEDGDWSRVAPYFAEDAIFEVRGSREDFHLEGREAIVQGLRRSCGYDRDFPRRTVKIIDQNEYGWRLAVDWVAVYTADRARPLAVQGHTTVDFDGDLIVELVEEHPDGSALELEVWRNEAYVPPMAAVRAGARASR